MIPSLTSYIYVVHNLAGFLRPISGNRTFSRVSRDLTSGDANSASGLSRLVCFAQKTIGEVSLDVEACQWNISNLKRPPPLPTFPVAHDHDIITSAIEGHLSFGSGSYYSVLELQEGAIQRTQIERVSPIFPAAPISLPNPTRPQPILDPRSHDPTPLERRIFLQRILPAIIPPKAPVNLDYG